MSPKTLTLVVAMSSDAGHPGRLQPRPPSCTSATARRSSAPDRPTYNDDTGFYEYKGRWPRHPRQQGRREVHRGHRGLQADGACRGGAAQRRRRGKAGLLFSRPRRGSARRGSTSFFEPRITLTRWCSCSGCMSRMRCVPVMAAPPACSTSRLMGLASYIRRSLPALPGSRASQGYMKMPPRVRMRCTSATIEAIQRMLKFLPRGPVSPARHSSM